MSAGTRALIGKIAERLQEPEKKTENLKQVKTTAKRSLLAQLEEHKKEVEEYKSQHYGVNTQRTKSRGQAIE